MEHVVFLGAHPDDFTGCCGTALRMRNKFALHIWDYTKGERGLAYAGVSLTDCAATREKEERNVAAYIGAELSFCGEIDGETFAPRETCQKLADMLLKIRPRAVFTHSVPDRHPDHVMTTVALFRALAMAQLTPEIYFYEFSFQSLRFCPTHLVDITPVFEEKIKLIRMYECQNVEDSIVQNKIAAARFRGDQIGCRYAEAFASCGFIPDGAKSILNELS